MFNLQSTTHRLQQLKYAKSHGLPYKRKPKDIEVQQIDSVLLDTVAQRESIAISHSFHNYSLGFGRRLSKAKGQRHHPGGGYAGHTIKHTKGEIK